jgi:hypothetical protein
MGTRGYIIVKFQNVYYRLYNHFDSYPEGLGMKLVEFIKINEMKSNDIIYIISYLIEYFGITHIKENLFVTRNASDIENDLFIEWVYIINLDNQTFKFTGGFYEPEYELNNIPSDWLENFQKTNEEMNEEMNE